MNVVISIGALSIGGGEVLPITLANELSIMGNNVTLHVLDNKAEVQLKERINKNVKILITRNIFIFLNYIKRNHIEVINTHSVSNQKWICRIKLFCKVRHIATVHGMFEAMQKDIAKKNIKSLDRNVDKWVYVAENSHETLIYANVNQNKMIKIHNAVYRPTEIMPIDLSSYNIPKNAYCVTVVSRAVEKKCWPECIETVKQARKKSGLNIHLILAGNGVVYNKLIKQTLPEYIHLIGTVNNPCSFYAASNIELLLSIRECAPLSLIEMYYAGIPVVATDTGDVREMMTVSENQMTGILLPLFIDSDEIIDINKASDAIVELLTDSEKYKQFKNNAIEKSYVFDVRKMAENYLSVFME